MSARLFSTTWWGAAWIDALEGAARLDPNRLARGRTYARSGAVHGIVVEPGRIEAQVAGSGGRSYHTEVMVATVGVEEWDTIAEVVATRAAHVAALADGELDPAIVADARSVGVELLPTPGDLRARCSCPDWAEPCKHAAAVCYLVAAELDRDPALLFLLRGLAAEQLAAMTRAAGRDLDARGQDDRFGAVAASAWADHRLDDPPAPLFLHGATAGLAPRHPGRPAPWEGRVPAGDPVDPGRTAELAVDAAGRAWSMLVDGAPSGLTLSARGDIARRAAACETSKDLATLAARTRLNAPVLTTWVDAWRLAGDEGVNVVADSDSWSIDQDVLSAGREALVDLGIPKRSVALNYDSLGMPRGVKLVVGLDGRWYRLETRPGRRGFPDLVHLAARPSEDIIDLVEAPPVA